MFSSHHYAEDDAHSVSKTDLQMHRRTGKRCDVIIKSGDRKFHAHRSVLSAVSLYFDRMFSGSFVEKFQSEIEIKMVEASILEQLLDFIYTGNIEINYDNIIELIKGADYLYLSGLRDHCENLVVEEIQNDNIWILRQFAKLYTCTELINATESLIISNFEEISSTIEFMEMSFEELSEIIKMVEFSSTQEIPLYNAIVGWITYNPSARFYLLNELLNIFEATEIPSKILMEVSRVEPLVRLSLDGLLCKAREHNLSHRTETDVVGDRIYVLGNFHHNDKDPFYSYSPCSNTWAKERLNSGKNLPESFEFKCVENRGLHATCTTNINRVYTYKYDTNIQTWEQKTLDVQMTGSIIIDNLSLMGMLADSLEEWRIKGTGLPGNSNIQICGTTTIQPYQLYGDELPNPVDNFATPSQFTSPMLYRRQFHGLATINDKTYACGGSKLSDPTKKLNTVEVYDQNMGYWRLVAPMNKKRSGLAVVAYNGKLFAFGGDDVGEDKESTAEKYCPVKNTWSFIAPIKNVAFSQRVRAVVVKDPVMKSLETKLYKKAKYSG